jgi:hypothetical protein
MYPVAINLSRVVNEDFDLLAREVRPHHCDAVSEPSAFENKDVFKSTEITQRIFNHEDKVLVLRHSNLDGLVAESERNVQSRISR